MPDGVVEPIVSVRVELPDPGAGIDVVLNAAVAPVGSPDALSAIAALKPPETVVVMVLVPLAPSAIVTDVGEAATVNTGTVTASVTVAVWVIPPPVPVTVIMYDPAATLEATATLMVELPEPGAAMDVGLKDTVTPLGCPLADRPTAELKPPETAVVMVDVPLLPCATVTEVGDADIVKLGVDASPVNAAIRPFPMGLPQPVTRS